MSLKWIAWSPQQEPDLSATRLPGWIPAWYLRTRDKSTWVVDGFKAWTVVFGALLSFFTVLGLSYCFGIFILPISTEFGADTAQVSLIGTINLGLFCVAGIFSGSLADRYGIRPILSVGAALWVTGMVATSYCYSFVGLFFTYGVLVGLGTGTVFYPALSVIPQWFLKKRGTAAGMAALGSGLGTVLFALAGEQMIVDWGWRGTVQVMAGIGGGLLFIAVLLIERRVPPLRHLKGGLFGTAKRLIKLRNYRMFMMATFFFQWGFFVPFYFIVPYSASLGFNYTVQGLSLAMMGIGSSVGRLLMGPIADFFLGRLLTLKLCMLACGTTLALWYLCVTIAAIYSFAFFYGFFAGGFATLMAPVSADLWGAESLGGTFTLLNVVMIPGSMAGATLAGALHDRYGNYTATIFTAAGFILMCALVLLGVHKEPLPSPVLSAAPLTNADQQVNPSKLGESSSLKSSSSSSAVPPLVAVNPIVIEEASHV